jgi:hypothetical protein
MMGVLAPSLPVVGLEGRSVGFRRRVGTWKLIGIGVRPCGWTGMRIAVRLRVRIFRVGVGIRFRLGLEAGRRVGHGRRSGLRLLHRAPGSDFFSRIWDLINHTCLYF